MPEAAAIKPQADAVIAAVKAAVVEHGEGEAHKGSTGLAIYFPANRKVHADYASIPFSRGGWDEFLKKGFSGAAAAAATVTISAPNPGQNHRLGQGLQVTAQVAGAPASIRASIGFRDKDGSITTISDEEVASPGAWKDGTTFSYTVRPKVRGIGDGKNTRLAPTTPLSPGSPYLRADASYNSLMGDLQVATIFDSRTGKLETIFCLNENGASNPTAVHPVKGEKLVFYQTVSSGDDKPLRYRPVPALVSSGSQQGKAKGKAKDGSGLRLVDTGLPAGDYILSLTAYNGAGAPMGRSHLQLTAGGEAVAPGVGYPNYGYPAVYGYDLQYVDLTLIIPVAEYGQFEATWSDYNFMAAAQADDYSTQDLVFLDEVALDPQELAFDEENWSDEFEDDSLEHDGDVDDDGTLDASDLDDDNDGTPDAADLDDDNDGEPDAEEEDEDNDGTSDDEDLDDDNDGTPDAEDLDDDSDGIPDAEDEEADDEGEDEAADDEGVKTKRPTTRVKAKRPTTKAKTQPPTTRVKTKRPTSKAKTKPPTTRVKAKRPTTKAKTKPPTTRVKTKRPTSKAKTKPPTTRVKAKRPTTKAKTKPPTTRVKTKRPTSKAKTKPPTTRVRTTGVRRSKRITATTKSADAKAGRSGAARELARAGETLRRRGDSPGGLYLAWASPRTTARRCTAPSSARGTAAGSTRTPSSSALATPRQRWCGFSTVIS